MTDQTAQKYINKIKELEKRIGKLEQMVSVSKTAVTNMPQQNEIYLKHGEGNYANIGGFGDKKDQNTDLDKVRSYIDHIRNSGMGKEKSLEFIEKFIDGLQKGED